MASIHVALFLLASTVAAAEPDKPGGPPTEKPAPLSVQVHNVGPRKIQGVYVATPRAAAWGANLLTRKTLGSGEQADISVPSGCGVYDIRLVAEDGVEYLDDGVRLCSQGEAASDILIVGEQDLRRARREAPSR